MNFRSQLVPIALTFLLGVISHAEIQITTGHSPFGNGFSFEAIPPPSNNDAATAAEFILLEGAREPNGGDLGVLHDGNVPSSGDNPLANFFFRAGTDAGRIRIDLGRAIEVKQVASYSWHTGSRAPQVYKLYAATGTEAAFDPVLPKGADPLTAGWKFITNVDTRTKGDDGAGQHGVLITETTGLLGNYRYFLFEIARAETRDAFGNTFYSEIDIIDADGPAATTIVKPPVLRTFTSADGKSHFTFDLTAAPDLATWSVEKLQPVIQEWYPRIVALLPSEGYAAPTDLLLCYRNDMGKTPASADVSGVNLNAAWFRGELQREACGAVVHELVHVVQKYWSRARRTAPRPKPNPGWIIEGIADYVRWFLYEPQTRGAEMTPKQLAGANYDASYRVSANFLNWVCVTYDKDVVRKLNAIAREGKYDEALWKEWTAKTLPELGAEWKASPGPRLDNTK